MNSASASARSSRGARSTADGCTVANTAGARSDSITSPRCFMTLKLGPSSDFAAVAPRQMMTSGLITESSASSHGRHARTSAALGVL